MLAGTSRWSAGNNCDSGQRDATMGSSDDWLEALPAAALVRAHEAAASRGTGASLPWRPHRPQPAKEDAREVEHLPSATPEEIAQVAQPPQLRQQLGRKKDEIEYGRQRELVHTFSFRSDGSRVSRTSLGREIQHEDKASARYIFGIFNRILNPLYHLQNV